MRYSPPLSNALRGQVLAGVLVLLLVLLILVPVMVMFVRNEARWTDKEQKNTTAFHLAEAATERGYWRILQSTRPTNDIAITGYKFDQSYSDISGGTYALNIGSDSSKNIIIIGIGRDALKKEVRAVKVVYAPNNLATNSEFSVGTNEIGGNLKIHWGPVYSQTNISGTPDDYPRIYAQGNIPTYCPGPGCSGTPPCTDNIHYWCCSCATFQALPSLDFNYYKNLAISYGAAPAGCHTDAGGANPSYYRSSGGEFRGCQDTSGKTYYNDGGDVNFQAGGGGNRIVGNVILAVSSSINLIGNVGSGASASYFATVPPYAWKEYGKNATTWNGYRGSGFPAGVGPFDTAAPATFPGLSSTYQTAATYQLSNVLIHGILWDMGDMNLTGSGNAVIHGVLYTASGITGTGNLTIYYDNTISLQTTTPTAYNRISWQDLPSQSWPTGLP